MAPETPVAPVTPDSDTPATRKPRTAAERRKASGEVKPVEGVAVEREYLIRRLLADVPVTDPAGLGRPKAWLEVASITAKSAPAALDAYAAAHEDEMRMHVGAPLEAITAKYRLERTPSIEVQTTISWT